MKKEKQRPKEERPRVERKSDYRTFDAINGKHPWQKAVPDGYVLYRVRKKHDGKILFFNFDLAKEMGLIPHSHPNLINGKLEKKVLDTFAIQIINEYDVEKKTKIPPKDIKPNYYMATRYLQIQHRRKDGSTSGDGRSIWNGHRKFRGKQWDFSSCGTGVTKLSPGAVEAENFICTGSKNHSYGSGLAGVDEGVSSAILSEIFHRIGVETERVLAVIQFPGNVGITVRTSENLIRPSHFFNHLKQNNLKSLQASIDYFIDRQIQNENWKIRKARAHRYDDFLDIIARRYGTFAAKLEEEYIFCWMDWDGDNMLTTGGIIDYGSIRQFGLFHHQYRYDDADRMSTTIVEQKRKALYILQTFAQIVDYINTGKKKNINKFKNHKSLKMFNECFEEYKNKNILRKMGFDRKQQSFLLGNHGKAIREFYKIYSWFEYKKSEKGIKKVEDGVNCYPMYSMRDILQELPKYFIEDPKPIGADVFMSCIKSQYSSPMSLRLDGNKRRKIRQFQLQYIDLVNKVIKKSSPKGTFVSLMMRAWKENSYIPVTGDAIIYITEKILRARNKFTKNELLQIMQNFIKIKSQKGTESISKEIKSTKNSKIIIEKLLDLVYEYRHSI